MKRLRIKEKLFRNLFRKIYGLDRKKAFSNLGEEKKIAELLGKIRRLDKFCVDMGASNGFSMSNTFALYADGWKGLSIECDPVNFAKLGYALEGFEDAILARCKITPKKAVKILEAFEVPKKFGFLNLDIDGYDYFVLEKLLLKFRPQLICAEINEKLPPPIKFTVKYNPKYSWSEDHFFGQSISQLNLLCEKYDYSIAGLEYNNAFLVPSELKQFRKLSPEEAYKKGYLEKEDRRKKFPWNEDFEAVHEMKPEEAVKFINKYFRKYKGKYICRL